MLHSFSLRQQLQTARQGLLKAFHVVQRKLYVFANNLYHPSPLRGMIVLLLSSKKIDTSPFYISMGQLTI